MTDRDTFGGAATQVVDLIYDVLNRWIGETVDADGDGDVDHATRFVYDGQQIVLQFESSSPLPLAGEGQGEGGENESPALQLTHRYLWGQAVDQLLCDEQVADAQTPGNVVWPLTDHLGTVRDLAILDTQTGETSVANHRVYDSFGQLTSETNAAVDCLFGFTGRPTSAASDLQNNRERIYDPATAVWLSEDPTEFTAGDTNTKRYVGNSSPNGTDPTGLVWVRDGISTWTATEDGDTLQELAILIHRLYPVKGEDPNLFYQDWVSIWPVQTVVDKHTWVTKPNGTKTIQQPKGTWDYWSTYRDSGAPIAKAGARADVRNLLIGVPGTPLLAADRKLLLAVRNQGTQDYFTSVMRRAMNQAAGGWIFTSWSSNDPGKAAQLIARESNRGATPIGELVIAAHWTGNHSVGELLGTAAFGVDDLFSLFGGLDNSRNVFEEAKDRHGPPRSWFTRTAQVWIAGCLTGVNITRESDKLIIGPGDIVINGPGGLAKDFADQVLRPGAKAYGTNVFLVGRPDPSVIRAYWSDDLSEQPRDVPNIHKGYFMHSLKEILGSTVGDHWISYPEGS